MQLVKKVILIKTFIKIYILGLFNSIKQNFIVCSDNIKLENIFPNKIIIYGLSDSNYLLEDEQIKYYT